MEVGGIIDHVMTLAIVKLLLGSLLKPVILKLLKGKTLYLES
jgi:hypothetical protein